MTKRKKILLWALACLTSGLCMRGDTQGHVTTVTDFSVPEYDVNGNIVSELLGDYADIMPDGRVRVRNLRIISYKNGEPELTVTSPECEYIEEDKSAYSDSEVRIARENLVVTGKGFSWDATGERMEIRSDVRVVLRNVQKQVKTGEQL